MSGREGAAWVAPTAGNAGAGAVALQRQVALGHAPAVLCRDPAFFPLCFTVLPALPAFCRLLLCCLLPPAEMTKAGIIEEMMNDSLDSAMDSEDREEWQSSYFKLPSTCIASTYSGHPLAIDAAATVR